MVERGRDEDMYIYILYNLCLERCPSRVVLGGCVEGP